MAESLLSWGNRASLLAEDKLINKIYKAPIAEGVDTIIKLAKPVPQFGKNDGDTWQLYRTGKLLGTIAPQPEDERTHESQTSANRTSGTLYEYANSINITGLVKTLSQITGIEDEAASQIRNDIDLSVASSILLRILQDTKIFYTPTSVNSGTIDTDGTITATGVTNFGDWHLRQIANYFTLWQVPKPWLAFTRPGGFDRLYETARGINKYTDKSVLSGREVPKYQGFEFHEVSFDTPKDIGEHAAAPLIPVTGRTTYTLSTAQNWFGKYVSGGTDFTEILFVGADDQLVQRAVAAPPTIKKEMTDQDRFISILWKAVWGVKGVWDETFTSATGADIKGRVRSLLVTTDDALTY